MPERHMSIIERLNEAIERLEQVERAAAAGPWHAHGGWGRIVRAGETSIAECGKMSGADYENMILIAAMRPTSEPEYYTKLLQDAAAEIVRLREGATSGVTLDEAYDIAEKIAEDYTGLHVGHEKQEVMTEQLVKRIARSIYEPKAEIPPEDAA